jgi:hypothetical protein
MQTDTTGNRAIIAYDNEETRETPKVVSGATWATVALLALIVILGALFIGGFFGSLSSGQPTSTGRPDATAQP